MGNVLATILSIVGTASLTCFLLVLYVRRTLPIILTDVGLSVSEQIGDNIKQTFADPNVSKAFSILGKKSGESRANNALREKAAEKILEGIPSIGFILDQMDLTPIEGLQLLNDPLIGPTIQGFLQKGMKGLLKGQAPSQGQSYRSEF